MKLLCGVLTALVVGIILGDGLAADKPVVPGNIRAKLIKKVKIGNCDFQCRKDCPQATTPGSSTSASSPSIKPSVQPSTESSMVQPSTAASGTEPSQGTPIGSSAQTPSSGSSATVGSSTGKTLTGSSTTPYSSTTVGPTMSVKEQAKSAVSESQTELGGLLADAEELRMKRSSINAASEISIGLIIEFKIRITRWTTDVERITLPDIHEIRNTTNHIRSIRINIKAGTTYLSNKSISELKATIKVTAIFLGDISKAIDDEKREEKLSSSNKITKTIKAVVKDIGEKAASLNDLLSKRPSSDSSSVSIDFVEKIITVIIEITTNGNSALTQNNLSKLTEYQSKLADLLRNIEGVTISSKDRERITKVISAVENASSAIESAIRENEQKAAAHEKLLLHKDLLSATEVVKESLAKITAAKEAASGKPTTSSFTIPADIIEVYSLLQTSLESLTWNHTEKLKSFELIAENIIGLLSTSNVDIIGLETLKKANKELQKQAKISVDELSSRSSVIAKTEITAEAKQSLTDIVQAVKDFKNKTLTGSQKPLSILDSTSSFLSSLDPESLSESTIAQLQSYSTQLAKDLDQALSEGVGVVGIDDLLSVAESVLSNVNGKLEIISKSKETVNKIETTEKVIILLSGFDTEVSAFSSKFSSSAPQSETSIIIQIEDVIVQVTEVLVKFVSKTYTIAEEDIIDIAGYLDQFKTSANQIQSFSEIKGLNQLVTLIQTAKEVVQGKQISFSKSFEAKKSLDNLEYISSFLAELRLHLSKLTDLGSSVLTSANFVVSEITQQLAFWREGVFYIQREQVDEVQGYLITLKSQTTSGDGVKGVSNLVSVVSNLETLVEGAKNITHQADQDTQGKINLESTYNLLTEAASSFQQLIELTKDFQGPEVTYEKVSKVTEKVAELSKKTTAITSQEVDGFKAALTELNEFIKGGGVQGKIKGLTKDFEDILDAKKLLQKKVKKDQIDKVEIIKEITQSISETFKLLETVYVDENLANISEYESIKSETIDEFYEFIVRVEEQPSSLGEKDLQNLLTITPEIQYTVSSASEYSIISGYKVNLTTILQKAKGINNTLSEIISQEETLKRDNEKLSLYADLGTYLSEIVSSLGRISKLENDSDPNSFKEEFAKFAPILQSLAENVGLFDKPSDLLQFLDLLYTIEQGNKKPAGTDSLLSQAQLTLDSVQKQIEEAETSNLIAVRLQNLNAVSEATSKIEKDLKIALDNISPDKLLGKPNKDIEDTIKFINALSSDVGSVTGDIILDLAGRLAQVTSSLIAPTGEQSAGNLLALKKSIEKFADNADRYTKDLFDREIVKEKIKDVQSSDEVLKKIKEELSNKISTITKSNITGTGSSEPGEISGLASKLHKIFDKSVYEVSAEELNESLNALKNLDVSQGVETPGIFALQSLVERSASDLELETQFLKSTELSRKSVDILSASSQYIASIESQLQNIINYFREDKNENKGTTPAVITDISALLGNLGGEEVSFSFVKDIETLSNDLKSLDLQVKINTGSILEVLELTRTASYDATQSLKNQESISKERHRNVLYERSSAILTQTRETLQTLDSNKTSNGPPLDNADITQFFSLIRELSKTAEINERKIDSLEAVLKKVKSLSSTELAGKDISGISEAINAAGQLEQNINDELSTSKKAVKLSAKKTTKLEIAKIFDQISSIVTSKISSIGIATQQIDSKEISDLQKTIEGIDLDAVSFEDVSVLKEKVDALEKLAIVEGTGINNLRNLKSTVISKTESTKQSSEVFSAISEVSESSRSLTQISEALSGLEKELSSVTVSSNNQGANETGILSEILEATYIDLSGSLELSTEKLEEITEKLQYVKKSVSFGSKELQTITSSITNSKKVINKELAKSGSKSDKLKQSTLLLDVQSKFKFISKKAEEIVSSNHEVTQTDQETEGIISKFIALLKRFRSSAIDVQEEDLTYISDNVSKLDILLAKKTNIKGISELKDLSDSVFEASSKEIKAAERDTKRENQIKIRTRQQNALTNAETLLKGISQKTAPSTSTNEEVSVLEVDKIRSIIKLIRDGTAKESDIGVLEGYTKSLNSLQETFTSGVRIQGLQDALSLVNSLQGSLEKTQIGDLFDSSYSEEVYKQKLFKSLLLDTYEELNSLVIIAGNGSEGATSYPIFADLLKTIQRLEKSYSEQTTLLLKDQLQTLRTVRDTIPANSQVTGLQELYQKTQSVIISTESGISRSDIIDLASEDVSNSKKGLDLILKIEKTIQRLSEKSGSVSSEGTRRITEIDEITEFFKNTKDFTSKEIAILKEYQSLLNRYNEEITSEKIEGLSAVRSAITAQKLQLNTRITETAQTYRAEKQTVYIKAANSQIQKTYNTLSSLITPDLTADVEEIEEVTRFSIFLNSVDIQSLSAAEISQINELSSKAFAAISKSTVKNIAYQSIIREKLTEFNYVADTQLQLTEASDREQRTSSVLKKSRDAIQDKASQLYSLTQKASGQTFTTYEESTVVTDLYNFLLPYIYDFRSINDDFIRKLQEFHIPDNLFDSIPKGVGVKYLEEVSSLTDKFLAVEKQASESVANLNSISVTKDLMSSFSLLSKTLDQFIYTDNSKSDAGGAVNNSPAEPSDTTLGLTTDAVISTLLTNASNTLVSGAPTYTTESASVTQEASLADELAKEIEQSESFKVIIKYVQDISSGSKDFKGQQSSEISEQVRNLLEGDIFKVLSKYSIAYLKRLLSTFNRISVEITSSVDTAETDVKVQKSFSKIEETLELLSSIRKTFKKISDSKRGSGDINSIISLIQNILKRFTSVHFISYEDVGRLRGYAYQLSAASASSNPVSLNLGDFEGIFSATYDLVASSYTSQSSFITVSKLSTSSSQTTTDQSSSFTSFSSKSKSSVTYSSDEVVTINDIRQTSQQTYIQKQFRSLLSFAKDSITALKSLGDSGPAASSEGGLGNDETEESELSILLSQVSVTLRILTSSSNTADFNSLTQFASSLNEIKSFASSNDSVSHRLLDDNLVLITSANDTLNSQIQSSEKYSLESQSFLNIQQSSSLVTDFTEIVDRIISDSADSTNGDGKNNTDTTEIENTARQYSKSITSFLLQYSLKSSAITEEAIKAFRESVSFFSSIKSFSGIRLTDVKTWKNFLQETETQTVGESRYSASRGVIVRSKTQKDLLLSKRAKKVVSEYLTLLGQFSVSLDGSSESTSPSKLQLVKIISASLEVSKQWEVGRIENRQIILFEKYIKELNQLLVLLRGTKLITEVTLLQTSLTASQKTIEASLIDINREVKEDESDAQIDDVDQIFTQIHSFVGKQIDTLSGNDSNLGDGTNLQDSGIEGNITYLLGIIRNSEDIITVDTQEIYATFTSIVFSLQKVSQAGLTVKFQKLLQETKNQGEFVKSKRQSIVFERTVTSVSKLSSVIPNEISIKSQSYDTLVYVNDIAKIQEEVHKFRRNIYSITRSDIRTLSRLQFILKSTIERYGFNIAYLSSITETLFKTQISAEKYRKQSLLQIRYKTSATVYSAASEDITNAESSITNLIASGDLTLETGNVTDDAIASAFYFFINHTFDSALLPKDLGSVISNFSFSSLQISNKLDYSFLKNTLHILKRFTELNEQTSVSLQYIESASHITEINGLITSTIEKLKEFVTNTSSSSDIDEGSSSPLPTTEVTSVSDNASDTVTEAVESSLTIDDIVKNILTITDTMFTNRLVLVESHVEDLNYYSGIIGSLPVNIGKSIKNLPKVINHLSQTSSYLTRATHAFESAYQVSESYSILKAVFEMNNLIKEALQKPFSSKGTAQTAGLINSIEEYYKIFIKGFTFISQGDISACFGLVYELNSLSGIQGDTTINSDSLLSLVEESERTLLEADGFLSAHYNHYQHALYKQVINNDNGNTLEAIKQLELSSSSQFVYILSEIEGLLSDIVAELKQFKVGSSSSDNNTELVAFSDITTILKATETDLNGLQLDTLYRLTAIADDLRFSNENNIRVNETYLNDIVIFVKKIKAIINITGKITGDYGISSTLVLLLQEVVTIINYASNETEKWIYGPQCSSGCSSVNYPASDSPVTSGDTNVSSSESTTNIPFTSSSPNRNITVLDSEFIQKSFDLASDILVHWTFDSSSVDFRSVSQFRNFMKSLEITCQLVQGLHLWDHILISSNITLLSLLQDVYLKQKLERAKTEEALLRYENALEVLKANLGLSPEVSEDNTGNASLDSSNLSTSEPPVDAIDAPDNELEIFTNLNHIVSLSNQILERWAAADYNIRRDETEVLESYQSEIKELVKAGGVLDSINLTTIRSNILQATNHTGNSVSELYQFSVESSKARSNVLGQNFFQQTKLLVSFSISLITELKNSSSVNSSTTLLSTSESPGHSANSSLQECEKLLCASEKLRDALLLLRNQDPSTSPSTVSATTSSADSLKTNGTEEASNKSNASFLDSYTHEQFIYGETRSSVYAFTKAFRLLGNEDPVVYDGVLSILEDSVKIIDEQLAKIESQSVTTSVNISSYVYISS